MCCAWPTSRGAPSRQLPVASVAAALVAKAEAGRTGRTPGICHTRRMARHKKRAPGPRCPGDRADRHGHDIRRSKARALHKRKQPSGARVGFNCLDSARPAPLDTGWT